MPRDYMRYPEALYFFFNFSQIILTELNIHLGNKLKFCIQWKTSYIGILVNLPIRNSYLIQTKARETGVIYWVMVEQLCIRQAKTRCTLPLFTQWHHKVLKYFIYILSPIYICIAKRAEHLQKCQVLHNICVSIFISFFPPKQQSNQFSHNLFNLSKNRT